MPTRNVVLTTRHEQVIADLVGSGRYQNASEVLRDGLRLLEQRDAQDRAKLAALQHATTIGTTDLDEGRSRDIPTTDLPATLKALSPATRTAQRITR